jgi:hypothetical protein
MVTYITLGNWRESNIAAVLNNRTAGTVEVDIYIVTIVYTSLPRSHDNNTVLDTSDMSSPGDMSSDYERSLDVLQHKAGKRCIVCCWDRHINNTSIEFSQRSRRRSPGGRGRQDDVKAIVT